MTEVQKHEEQCHIWLCGTKLDLVTEEPKSREVDFHDMTDYAEMVSPLVTFLPTLNRHMRFFILWSLKLNATQVSLTKNALVY